MSAVPAVVADLRAACKSACAADQAAQAAVWPRIQAAVGQVRAAMGPLPADIRTGLQAMTPLHLPIPVQKDVDEQGWACFTWALWRVLGVAHPVSGSGRDAVAWHRWVTRGDLPWPRDVDAQLRHPVVGERIDDGAIPLCELAPCEPIEIGSEDPLARWQVVIVWRGQPLYIIGQGGVVSLLPVFDPHEPLIQHDPARAPRPYADALVAERTTAAQTAVTSMVRGWRTLVFERCLEPLRALDSVRSNGPCAEARRVRREAVTAWIDCRHQLAEAGAVYELSPERRREIQEAILADMLNYPDDRAFRLHGYRRRILPKDVVADMVDPTGGPNAATGPAAAAAPPASTPAAPVAGPQAVIRPSLPDVERRLKQIGASVALPPATWSKLERSLRCFLMRDPAAPRGIVLHGPPGTGKTTIAKSIAAQAGCAFVSLSAPDLKQQFIGASGQKVKEIWDQAAGKPTIIFIDECDAIFQKRGGLDSDKFTDEIVAAILPRMDGMAPGGNILVVGATNRFDAMDPAIVSRFDLAVPVPLPDAAARAQILASAFTTYLFTGQPPQALVDASDGLSGRELEAMVRSARQDVLAGESPEQVFARATTAWRARSSSNVNRNLTWDDVVVSDATRTTLQRYAAMLPRREELKRLGLDVLPKGVLLTGPPGTGKTQLARVLAATAQVGFVAAATADLKAGFLGQSGQRVKEVFSRARSMSPCILFVDELDIIAPARGSGDALTQEIVGQLLQELDGVVAQDAHIFLMAASNVPDAIDSAVLSRFSDRIEIPLPDLQQRERIILALLRGRPVQGDPQALAAALAAAMNGASGRDLKNRIENGLRLVAERALRSAGVAHGLCAADALG